MTIKAGDSYYSLRRDDVTFSSYDKWDVPLDFLPTRYAPLEKQLRVFVNDEEYAFDDDVDPSRTTKLWSWAEGSITGVPCWGVRYRFNPSFGLQVRIAELGVFDQNGYLEPEEVIMAPVDADAYDRDGTTGETRSNPGTLIVSFPAKRYLTKVGWSRSDTSVRDAHNMNISVNVGTSEAPEWVAVYSKAGHTYPALSTPYNPETDLVIADLTSSALVETAETFTVTITPALQANSDRVTFVRETRQDRPWVRPIPNARAYGHTLANYWDQFRFIYQEQCELPTVAPLVGLPVAELVPNDYTGGNQLALGANTGSSQTVIDYSNIELLEGFPGAPADPAHQIVVEAGNTTSGNSTTWTTINPGDYTIDASAKTITLDSGVAADIRARRVTRKDKLWKDIRTVGPIGWNSPVIVMLQKQIRFLREEACFLPLFYAGHPLGNPIFPRAWNWLVFTGGGGSFTFGGPAWGGDGVIVVYENDVLLTEGTDYTVNWPTITLNTPAGPNDVVTIGGGGGGGFGAPLFPGGDDAPSLPVPPVPGSPVPWPGLDLALGFTVSVSSGTKADLADGNWEGGTEVDVTQSNLPDDPLAPLYLKIRVDVTDPDDSLFGHAGVLWMRGYCGTGGSLFAVAAADDTTGDGTFNQAASTSPAIGCLGSPATTSQDLVRSKLGGLTRSSATSPILAMAIAVLGDMQDADIQGSISNLPLFGAWEELAQSSISAEDAGVVDAIGFTAEQFENYINPDVDFDDFDIPAP